MGEVVPFRLRSPAAQVIRIEQFTVQDVLHVTMGERLCPHCKGRGWIFASDPYGLSIEPCPCGGDDENRINPDEPDYPGAA